MIYTGNLQRSRARHWRFPWTPLGGSYYPPNQVGWCCKQPNGPAALHVLNPRRAPHLGPTGFHYPLSFLSLASSTISQCSHLQKGTLLVKCYKPLQHVFWARARLVFVQRSSEWISHHRGESHPQTRVSCLPKATSEGWIFAIPFSLKLQKSKSRAGQTFHLYGNHIRSGEHTEPLRESCYWLSMSSTPFHQGPSGWPSSRPRFWLNNFGPIYDKQWNSSALLLFCRNCSFYFLFPWVH